MVIYLGVVQHPQGQHTKNLFGSLCSIWHSYHGAVNSTRVSFVTNFKRVWKPSGYMTLNEASQHSWPDQTCLGPDGFDTFSVTTFLCSPIPWGGVRPPCARRWSDAENIDLALFSSCLYFFFVVYIQKTTLYHGKRIYMYTYIAYNQCVLTVGAAKLVKEASPFVYDTWYIISPQKGFHNLESAPVCNGW